MSSSLFKFTDLSPTEAIALQKELREKVLLVPLSKPPQLIAGADISLEWHGDTAFAGIVVLSYPKLEIVETSFAKRKIDFPYIPGLLSFREIPTLLEAWKKLRSRADLVMVDGHGIAHPRRTGIATHFGLSTNTPTIGVAKNKLYGNYTEPEIESGGFSYLFNPKTGEEIGASIRTKTGVKPVFVSPGHRTTLEESIRIALGTTRGYKLPEPTRQAHNLTNEFRRGEI